MSQGKRAKVRAATRHRESEAREIAASQLGVSIYCGMCSGIGDDIDDESMPVFLRRDCSSCEGTGSGRRALALALLSDPSQGFDVHLAREHAEQLIVEATVRADRHYAAGNVQAAEHQGGRIRLGRRILAALEGQPSECPRPMCQLAREAAAFAHKPWVPSKRCQDCSGTGHNLRGVLPPVEWSPQVRRKVFDGAQNAGSRSDTCWIDDVDVRDQGQQTRTVARGLHWEYGHPAGSWSEHILARRKWTGIERLERPDFPEGQHSMDRLPRWRRGELRHAEQRRERRLRHFFTAAPVVGTMAEILAVPGVTGAHVDRAENAIHVQATVAEPGEYDSMAAALHAIVPASVRIILDATLAPRVEDLHVTAEFTIE